MAARSSGKPSHIYLGLMSGTSMDGVDAAAVEFSGEDYKVLGSSHLELPADLAKQLYQLCLPGKNEIEAMAEADIKVAKLFSKAVDKLLSKLNLSRNRVAAIGSHGQTIRHLPELGTTIQIGDPNVIAHETGILTVADFRRADMAAGGQGAPLVPAFHKKIFQDEAEHRVILNIGGIANITQLPSLQSNGTVIGYDTGPGNGLMNMWAQQQLNRAFDEGGRWAASGQNNSALFELCITDPYFDKTAPKSTGREYFNLDWLGLRLNRLSLAPSPEDVQATLLELTARSITDAIFKTTEAVDAVYVCGGGVHNTHLMDRIRELMRPIKVATTQELGVDPDYIEAIAFAWLAKQCLKGLAGNLPEVTGASGEKVLGSIYQATVKQSP